MVDGPDAALTGRVGARLGTDVVGSVEVAGGDINRAFRLGLADGRRVFVKTNAAAPAGMFTAEARGLAWLAEVGAVRVPEVLAVGDPVGDDNGGPPFLVLEWIEAGPPAADHDERLGLALAALHAAGCPRFGLTDDDGHAADNWIGTIPQPNAPTTTWPEFYGRRRLEPLVRSGVDRGLLPPSASGDLDGLLDRLVERCGPPELPRRLHGDLWGGNAMVDADGAPVLVDPAVYGGHREVDLAMMRLFGGFGRRVFEAYAEALPLAAGHEQRVALYQLYPLLVHAHLFGGAYVGRFVDLLHRCR